MERAKVRKNLEALAEVEDEEEIEEFKDICKQSRDESESDSEEDSEIWHGEQNKFDSLCDGLLNAMALVHSALKEILEMKDKLLQQFLPPSVHIHLSMTSSKLFRSVSDLSMPVNELVRLVRIYSTPWEEKSTALKKLHEGYESKQRQLNIAIKRLQLVDAHSKRIAREKRIMNWEKLFAKLTTTKGHGRRWKFLIGTIKQKAKMGLEHVQAYTQALEETSESDNEEDISIQTSSEQLKIKEVNNGTDDYDDDDSNEDKDEDSNEDDDPKNLENGEASEFVPHIKIHAVNNTDDRPQDAFSRSGSPKKVKFEEASKPEMKDKEISTKTPDYDRSLFVRIFCPEGLQDKSQLKCSLTCNGHIFRTSILDSTEDEEKTIIIYVNMEPEMKDKEISTKTPDDDRSLFVRIFCPEGLQDKSQLKCSLTCNGQIFRTKETEHQPTKRPQAAGGNRRTPERSSVSRPEGSSKKSRKFNEFEVKLPDEIAKGVLKMKDTIDDPVNLQIAVHHGQYEELIATTTIDFSNIKELSIPTVYLPSPRGDDHVLPSRAGSFSDIDSLSDSVDLMLPDETSNHTSLTQVQNDPAQEFDALSFPLYPVQAARSAALHKPCATLPLVMYWGKRERPRVFNRQTETVSLFDLVFDLTGIDLSVTTKEDLHKETADRSASVIAFTPEAKEETVSKVEYDHLVSKHQEELQHIQNEYEKRLQELFQNLQSAQEENIALSQQQQQILCSLTAGSQNSRASHIGSPASPGTVTSKKTTSPQSLIMEKKLLDLTQGGSHSLPETASSKLRTQRSQRSFKISRTLPKWGESLPQDFFERLHWFEEESKAHKQELNERTLSEIQENLEKKLSSEHKLSKREEQMYDALKDVSLPALFMPFKTGNVFNPRAHQYFHPTGAHEVRLTQPPSMFQLPPLPRNGKIPVVNLFELSKNFHTQGPDWLIDRYIQQQRIMASVNDSDSFTPAPATSIHQNISSAPCSFPRPGQNQHALPESPAQVQNSHYSHISAPQQEVDV